MPVTIKEWHDPEDIFKTGADAVAVPRMRRDERIPRVTEFIYDHGDRHKIDVMYADGKPASFLSLCGAVIETGGCGLDFDHVFHMCVEPAVVYKNAVPLDPDMSGEEREELLEIMGPENLYEPPEADWDFEHGDRDFEQALADCYENLLRKASALGVRRLVMPLPGMEDNSLCPYRVAYDTANYAPRRWLDKNTAVIPLTAEEEEADHLLRLIKLTDSAAYERAKVRRAKERSEMDVIILIPPAEFRYGYAKSGDPDDPRVRYIEFDNRLNKEISDAVDKAVEKRFNKRCGDTSLGDEERKLLKQEIKADIDKKAILKEFEFGFLNERIGRRSDINSRFSELTGYNPRRFILRETSSAHLHYVVGLAVCHGITDGYERYKLIRCAGHDSYPFDDFGMAVERLFEEGLADGGVTKDNIGVFRRFNEALTDIDPDYDLTKPVKHDRGMPSDKSAEKNRGK